MKKLIVVFLMAFLFVTAFMMTPASASASVLDSEGDADAPACADRIAVSEEPIPSAEDIDIISEPPADIFEADTDVASTAAAEPESDISADRTGSEPETEAPAEETAADLSSAVPDTADSEEPVDVLAAADEGWVTSDGKTRYYRGGEAVTGFQRINGSIFRFGGDGVLLSDDGWHTIDGNRYYIRGGEVLTGCQFIDGVGYLFGDDGVFSGENGNVGDMFFVDGQAVTGPQKVGSDMYLFDIVGRRVTAEGWKTVADENDVPHTYYVRNGALVNGFAWIDGTLRLFRDYEFVSDSGWVATETGKYYICDGRVCSGMNVIENRLYFLDPNANGVLRTGWLELYGTRYHADESGVITYGKAFSADGVMYAADANGAVVTGGFASVGGKIYYADNSGVLTINRKFVSDGRTYIAGSDGVIRTNALFDFEGKTYISDGDGALRTGWIKFGGYYYYAGGDFSLLKSTKIDGYYLDSNGRRVTDKAAAAAAALVDKITNNSMTDAQKLRACFDWLVSNCSYKRDYTDPTTLSGNWRADYAYEMLTTQKGNCYRYASAFAYLAEVLGYDSQVVCGRVSAVGGGTTPHAFTQIKINGKTYICDANLQSTRPSYNWYMITYDQYHYYFLKQKVYEVSAA